MPWSVVRSRAARQDFDDLWSLVAQDDIDAADRLLDRIDESIEQLRDFPRLGRERSDLAAGLRGKLAGSVLILYRLDQAARRVVILRAVDGRRDLASLFVEP